MNINFHSFTQHTTFFLKETFLPSLSARQQKILIIASIVFGCLTACYRARQCLFGLIKNDQEKKTLSDGTILEGRFLNGKLHGPGKITTLLPQPMIMEGNFQNSLLNGKGKLTVFKKADTEEKPEEIISVLEGDFELGQCRSGTLSDQDETISMGQFEDFQLKEGKIVRKNGVIFEGTYHNGIYVGTMTYPHGPLIKGCFDNSKNLLDGQVEFTFADGTRYEGKLTEWDMKGKKTDLHGIVREGEFTIYTLGDSWEIWELGNI